MTTFQRVIKYLAMAFAIFLTVSIIGGILSVTGLIGGFADRDDTVTEDIKTYSVSSDIQSLVIKINAADLTIKKGEKFSVESNLKYLTVEDENGVLTVKETKKFNVGTYTGAVLTLYIPSDTVFDKMNIMTGAGKLTADHLSSDRLKLELGAGEVIIDTLFATSDTQIDGGAGEITISGGSLHDLDLDMGVGRLDITSALTGESDFDLGVGESNITVIGNKDDYKLNIEKGIGNITVDGVSVSSIKEQGNGNNDIEINGGIGAINLKFEEPETK